ncbi:hypothetical protein BS17DRAFT_354561 [Gyrodon lividus]|nr:hypothetical protein BS17DRAFT_354561 [Gyrodon lividus]
MSSCTGGVLLQYLPMHVVCESCPSEVERSTGGCVEPMNTGYCYLSTLGTRAAPMAPQSTRLQYEQWDETILQ